jgi:hypothetical protein
VDSIKPVFTGAVWVAKRSSDAAILFEHKDKAVVMEWMLERFFKEHGSLFK